VVGDDGIEPPTLSV